MVSDFLCLSSSMKLGSDVVRDVGIPWWRMSKEYNLHSSQNLKIAQGLKHASWKPSNAYKLKNESHLKPVYGCTPLNSEEFMRRAVYHKVYVLKFFCKTKIWGPFIWGIV